MPAPTCTACRLDTAEDARAFFAPRLAALTYERLCIAHLGRDGRVLGESHVDGAADRAETSFRRIIADALGLGAEAMLVAHNHPGGSPEPSIGDIGTTRLLAGVAAHLGIALRDHLILVPDRPEWRGLWPTE